MGTFKMNENEKMFKNHKTKVNCGAIIKINTGNSNDVIFFKPTINGSQIYLDFFNISKNIIVEKGKIENE